jgi:CopG family nickel-responsive transcriptional regulator
MSGAERFTVSVEPELLEAFDRHVEREGMATRSEAVKHLMRNALIEQEWDRGGNVAGALVMVYDHHRRDLVQKLTDVQHDYGDTIISTQHVHLDHDNCLEVVTLKGRAADIRTLVGAIKALKGLKHTSLVMTTTGSDIA